jgi:hypothetical protein
LDPSAQGCRFGYLGIANGIKPINRNAVGSFSPELPLRLPWDREWNKTNQPQGGCVITQRIKQRRNRVAVEISPYS